MIGRRPAPGSRGGARASGHVGLSGGLLLLLALAACAGPRIPRPEPEPAARSGPPRTTPKPSEPAPPLSGQPEAENPRLARWEGGELRAADLGRWYLEQRPGEALGATSRLIGLAILRREAAEEGLACPGEWLARQREEIRAELEREAVLAYGVGTTVERYVALAFQRSVEDHLAARLQAAEERYLFSHLIRYRSLQEGRVALAVIALSDLEAARDAAARLDEGADFARLAARVSVLEGAETGGQLPWLPPSALHPAVAARVGRLAEGARSGILELDQEGAAGRYWIVRLRAREAPLERSYAEARERIAEDLARRPVTADEWAGWYRRIERLYKVRLSATFDRP